MSRIRVRMAPDPALYNDANRFAFRGPRFERSAACACSNEPLAIVYLAAAIVALGTLVCQFWGPYTYRFMLLMRDPMPRIVVTACGGVVAIGVLVSFFRLMFARCEPSCVHPAGERNIEVTLRRFLRVLGLLPSATTA